MSTHKLSDGGPIGVFDSGVGGLTVVRHLRAQLPEEDILYVADSACAPYGERSVAEIRERTLLLGKSMAQKGCKALLIACNTATGVDRLRQQVDIPVIAMEPALKPAAQLTRSGVIGILATAATLSSARYAELKDRHGGGVVVQEQVCRHWVSLAESGDSGSLNAQAIVAAPLRPLLRQGADVLVLGCTHFPLLRDLIVRVAGPDVTLVDPSLAVVNEMSRRLQQQRSLRVAPDGALLLYATDLEKVNLEVPKSILGVAPDWSSFDLKL